MWRGGYPDAELLTSLGREAVAPGLVSASAGHLRQPTPTLSGLLPAPGVL